MARLGQKILKQFARLFALARVRCLADSEHGFGAQAASLLPGLGGRMEEIEEHIPGRRLLTQEQLHRVRRTLPRRLQRQITQPLGQGFAVALGSGLDLPQLLGRDPGGDGFGAKSGLLLHACGGIRVVTVLVPGVLKWSIVLRKP